MAQALVLDSFALVAYFLQERAASRVQQLIDEAAAGDIFLAITAVNLGEVLYLVEREGGLLVGLRAMQYVRLWPVDIFPADEELAVGAARIKSDLRMGYLDCFVVALAQKLRASVVTGDSDFRRAEGLVEIEWLESNARR